MELKLLVVIPWDVGEIYKFRSPYALCTLWLATNHMLTFEKLEIVKPQTFIFWNIGFSS